MQVTILGKRYELRFTRLPKDTHGECDPPNTKGKQIRCNQRLEARAPARAAQAALDLVRTGPVAAWVTEVTFLEVEPALTELLQRFGPRRTSDHPEQPFWRLQNDGVWVVHSPNPLPLKTGDTIPRVGALRSPDVKARFTPEVRTALVDPRLVTSIASSILAEHFPESLHEDILDAVGLSLEVVQRRKRDPGFRQRVLKAYEYRCAVCGFDVRLGSVSIALDAAHIHWHQAHGPDEECNGLALCVLHHKVFDLGAFTVDDGTVLVSDQANGTSGFAESLLAYHGKPIRATQHPDWKPAPKYLAWHKREVFKGEPRHRG